MQALRVKVWGLHPKTLNPMHVVLYSIMTMRCIHTYTQHYTQMLCCCMRHYFILFGMQNRTLTPTWQPMIGSPFQ
jgi:hypothetical protein